MPFNCDSDHSYRPEQSQRCCVRRAEPRHDNNNKRSDGDGEVGQTMVGLACLFALKLLQQKKIQSNYLILNQKSLMCCTKNIDACVSFPRYLRAGSDPYKVDSDHTLNSNFSPTFDFVLTPPRPGPDQVWQVSSSSSSSSSLDLQPVAMTERDKSRYTEGSKKTLSFLVPSNNGLVSRRISLQWRPHLIVDAASGGPRPPPRHASD
ncbi:hypothetical protein EVAR_78335_1 [Eumeta japonica]|uniref:Uncharacterized protein n=1 Tax=Eumeta variegata TaxID=151549 RepID=A0A4C1T473_EUMVA|nr:hypothetical protein EVAR_78335_1 [Eumeta japonica]